MDARTVEQSAARTVRPSGGELSSRWRGVGATFASRRYGMEPDTKSARNLQYGRKTGIAALTERLVKALSGEARVPSHLRHAARPGDIAQRTRNPGRVVGRLLKPGIKIGGHFLRVT